MSRRKGISTVISYWLLLVFLLPDRISCLPELIRIGGLFGNEEDPAVEHAFRYAVYRINHVRNLLPKTKLVYDIQRLPTYNAFLASKSVCFQVSLENTTALFGPRSNNLAAYVNSLCSALHVPHIETRMDSGEGPLPGFSVNLYPNKEQLGRAYCDVIKFYKWEKVLIVYDDKIGLLKLQSLLRGPSKENIEVVVREADNENLRSILKEAKEKKWSHIIVDMNITNSGIFLKMALQEGMIDPYHHYLFTNLDIETIDMDDYRHNYVNLTGFRLVDPDNSYVSDMMWDMDTYERQTDLRILNRTGYPTLTHESALMFDAVWLFAKSLDNLDQSVSLNEVNISCDDGSYWESGASLYNYLNLANIRGLTGDIKLKEGQRLDFKLDLLQLKYGGLQKVGTWKISEGINFTDHRPGDGAPFGNSTLKVTTILDPPYVQERKADKPLFGNDRYEGFCLDLLDAIAEIVNFEYEIKLVPDGRYGVPDKITKEWDGMVRELIDRRADLAVAPLTINYNREEVIDFTKPFLNLGISILFKVPKPEKPGLFSFLNPLAIEIWLYVIGAYLLVSFTIFFLARFSPYEWYNPHPCNPDTDTVENTFSLSNSFWFTVGTLMQQGSDINPRAISTRIVGGIWWFFTLIIISSYTANLAAFLTVERMVSPIEGAEDLAKQTEISYGTLAGGSTMTFFRDSEIDTYKRMWAFMESKEPSVFVESYADALDKVLAGNYAFLMESTAIEYVTQRNCDLMQVGGLLDSKGYGIGTPTNSPFRDKISMAILELQEGGKIQKLYNRWWKDTGTCNRDEKKESKAAALGVENVGGIFVVLLGGLALSVIVAVIEFIYKSKKNAEDDRQSLCSEMAEELRFAMSCVGSSSKPKYKNRCPKCKDTLVPGVPHRHEGVPEGMYESPNGLIKMKEVRQIKFNNQECEYDFKPDTSGSYVHTDLSDGEV